MIRASRRSAVRISIRVAGLSGLLALTGCAAAMPGFTSGISTPAEAETSGHSGSHTGELVNGVYVLSADEQKFDCKQLTGRMQIRILEIRDYNERNNASLASRALKSAIKPLFGGGTRGNDPGADYAKDRAMLDAYNKQLGGKSCKTYDLDAELKPKDFTETPTVVTPPGEKKKAK